MSEDNRVIKNKEYYENNKEEALIKNRQYREYRKEVSKAKVKMKLSIKENKTKSI